MTARTDPSDPHHDLAGVLHDVSNALTVLLGWVGEARAPEATPEAVAYALTIIEQRARIARDLARHAIGSARIDEQRQVGAIAEELAQALHVEAHRAGVSLVLRGAEGPARVAGGLDFSQVLTNLVLNALAYAPAGSTVSIDIDVSEDSVTVSVKDEGPGVPAERHESIFEGDSQRPGGTGVGLRHARALARSWGGDVTLAASVRGERGARFHMFWPRVDAVPRPPVSASRFSDLSGLRVLLVEDDPAVTQLLEAALDARGAVITVAKTQAAFEEALRRGDYDAALVDLSPIAANAAGSLAAFRARCPAANVVLITGQADALPEAVLTERIELVRKPFEVREVVAALVRKRA